MSRHLVILCLALCFCTAFAQEPASGKKFALIEIFSSEGCSSCPPADRLVNALVRQAKTKKIPLYLLSWHVDYWNRLRTHHGVWVDPYSSPESTQRQRRYVRAVPAPGRMRGKLVTPQIYVDGRHPAQLRKGSLPSVVTAQAKKERKASIALTRTKTGVDWSVTDVGGGNEVLVALVQRNIRQHVNAGENSGKDLEHENVVRWHTIIKLDKAKPKGNTAITLPAGVSADSAGIIAVVQNSKDMSVQAVASIDWKVK